MKNSAHGCLAPFFDGLMAPALSGDCFLGDCFLDDGSGAHRRNSRAELPFSSRRIWPQQSAHNSLAATVWPQQSGRNSLAAKAFSANRETVKVCGVVKLSGQPRFSEWSRRI